jgi:predicted nucleic acid-binding Zn ribbon protein
MRRARAHKRENRRPVSLKDLLSGQTSEQIAALGRLKKLWQDVSGGVGQFSFPYRLNGGTLYVAVTEQTWIAELPYIKPDILEKLTLAGLDVTDIRFTMARYNTVRKEETRRLRELTEAEELWLEEISSGLPALVSEAFKKALSACIKAGRIL